MKHATYFCWYSRKNILKSKLLDKEAESKTKIEDICFEEKCTSARVLKKQKIIFRMKKK